MSAYVTYSIRTFDADGAEMKTLAVRSVCKPTLDQALTLAMSANRKVRAVEVIRSVPSRIQRLPHPATSSGGIRRVAAQIRIGA